MLLLLLLVAGVTNTLAQNVTISPQNGSMICALTSGSPTTQLGFQIGAFGTWKHEQLSLTMTASNDTYLTDDGQLVNHANHFLSGDKCEFISTQGLTPENYIVTAWGGAATTAYITIALPKGYRFTGYTFHLSHDVTKFGESDGVLSLSTRTDVTMTETDSKFSANTKSVTVPANSSVTEFKRTGNDMGNVLYFKTSGPNTNYYALTFRYVELTFTADADAPIALKPGSQVSTGVSMLEVPFATGKVDLGKIEPGTYQGATRVSYHYNTVTDMSANMLLYEAESVQSGTGFDGTSGDVAYSKPGSITTAGDFFKLTTGTKEQVYFLETPVYATMSNGEKNPIQFRMVGANVEYNNGSNITMNYDVFTIHYDRTTSSWGGTTTTTYYANSSGSPTSSSSQAATWFIDENGHIRNSEETNLYLTVNNNNYVSTTDNVNDAVVCEITSLGEIRKKGTEQYLIVAQSYGSLYFRFQANQSSQKNISKTGDQVSLAVSASAGECTLKVYGADGKTAVSTTTVNNSNKSGNIPLTGLNNDAIKFSVQGTGYVKLNVTLQALNPYVDQMSVVMNDTDNGKNLRMAQTFTSDDFSVGGDTFVFYLPEDCAGDDISMTFEDLYSKYGDDTYNHTDKPGTSDSRYNFVKSQHHQAFTNDNIYNGKAEAASDVKESVRIANKQNVRTQVGIVGNVAFRFNNADELSTKEGYMTEYPFTLANYANQTNPGAGSFVPASIEDVGMSTNPDADKKTFYVFTTDETKYNIAPTTATQHRSYAFYTMNVELICRNYHPNVAFEKIYSNAFYEGGTSDFYGATVSAPADVPNGLASDVATYKAIATAIADGGTDVPTDINQILYLDMSSLKGVYHSTASEEDAAYALNNFNELKAKFAKNALVFLPENTTSTFDNFAYANKGEIVTFQSANNIILTDKNPFYSPYNIQVDAADYAVYTRKLTKSTYSGEEYATVIMPFTIKFDEGNPGVKTDANYGTFTFLQMQEDNAISEDYNYKTAFFKKTEDAQVEANTPYALHVENKGESTDCFTLRQYGSDIVATPATAKSESGNTLFSATAITSTGNLTDMDGKNHTYTFNHKGSFSGYKIPKNSPKTFYFANNGFYSSADLKSTYTTVDLFPFRSVYEISTGGSGSAKFGFVRFMEGENTTGIVDINRDNNYSGIATGEGTITITADAAGTYRIFSAAGQNASNVTLRAGETKTVNVPAGVYVVNGVKVLVK